MPAFRIPLRNEPHADGKHEARPCPACKEPFTPTAGSRLACHAHCLFTPEALDYILTADRAENDLAGDYGVPRSIIRAAKKEAKRQAEAAAAELANGLSGDDALRILAHLSKHPHAAVRTAVRQAVSK